MIHHKQHSGEKDMVQHPRIDRKVGAKPRRLAFCRVATGLFAAALLLSSISCASIPELAIPGAIRADSLDSEIFHSDNSRDDGQTYASYAAGFSLDDAENAQTIDLLDDALTGGTITEVEGHSVRLLDNDNYEVIIPVEVEQDGLYMMDLTYVMPMGRNQPARLAMTLDGELPFNEAATLQLNRLYTFVNEDQVPAGERYPFDRDGGDNEIRPDTIEIHEPLTAPFKDSYGIYGAPYRFELTAGRHEIGLELMAESIGLIELTLAAHDELPEADRSRATVLDAETIMIQAESLHRISDQTIFPTRDNSSVDIIPSDPNAIRLNTVGMNTWKYAGQTASWRFDVETSGWYQISFKARQDVTRGMNSGRVLRIDGEIPFAEAELVRFPFSDNWQFLTLADHDAENIPVYLEAGEHTLSLEATSAETSDILRELQRAITDLNHWYRQIIMVTGSNPDGDRQVVDMERDYNLEQKIPGLLEGFTDLKHRLDAIQDLIDQIGGTGNAASFISEVTHQLESFLEKPYTIPRRLSQFSGNISSLSTLMSQLREQPLELDYIALTPWGQEPNVQKSSWWNQFMFRTRALIGSFSIDYNALESTGGASAVEWDGQPLRIWISVADLGGTANTGVFSGRDQAEVLRTLIDDQFTPATGIPVEVSLVPDSGILIQATMAGVGPDVASFVGAATPAQLAMRGALADVSEFAGWEEDIEAFHPSAIVPFNYEGGYYAMPETQSFDMMFYRTDIFEELELELPNTWEEFYALLPQLQQFGMQAGVYQSDQTFASLLYQKGGTFYNEELTATAFDEPEALEAFRQWTGFYVNYSMPLVFDFFNRFRTGEMPLGIVRYTHANYLSAGAPELEGLWNFAPVPGTLQEDGSIDRSVTADATASIILAASPNQDAAYEYVRWWTGTDAQARFGQSLEQIMGPSARYPTANLAAFDTLPWDAEQSEMLKAQWEDVIAIPPVPGNYQIQRDLSFAFRSVVYSNTNPRETLNRYNIDINDVITRKRQEFGLPVRGEE